MRQRSTEASVWPARFSTPPVCARSGNMWPGRSRSDGRVFGSIAVRTVAARSAAEMPVVVRPRASIETVNAVPKFEVFSSTIGGSPSSSQRSSVSARQIRPRPSRAMKLIASGVTLLGREDEVALVLPVLVVHDDDELPGREDLVAAFLDRGERESSRSRHRLIFSRRRRQQRAGRRPARQVAASQRSRRCAVRPRDGAARLRGVSRLPAMSTRRLARRGKADAHGDRRDRASARLRAIVPSARAPPRDLTSSRVPATVDRSPRVEVSSRSLPSRAGRATGPDASRG